MVLGTLNDYSSVKSSEPRPESKRAYEPCHRAKGCGWGEHHDLVSCRGNVRRATEETTHQGWR